MYSKKINKNHLLTEIWNCKPHIVKLWFLFLALRDEKAVIYESLNHIKSLSKLEDDQFTDALDFLLGCHEDNTFRYITGTNEGFEISCLDKKEKNNIELVPLWKERSKKGYDEYIKMTKKAFNELVHDYNYMFDLKEFYPNHDIIKSIQNCFVIYWGTEKAWLKKRRQRVMNINWRETIRNTIKYNLVKRDTTQKDYEYDYLVEKIKSQSRIIEDASV